jgi:hypothetical protein
MRPEPEGLANHAASLDWDKNMTMAKFGPYSFPIMSGAIDYLRRAYGNDVMTHVQKFNHTNFTSQKVSVKGITTFTHLAPSLFLHIPSVHSHAPKPTTEEYWKQFYTTKYAPT